MDGSSTDERRDLMRRAFSERFGGEPSHWVRAPGRVDAMGSHTDYNEGFVLTIAIDRDTWIAAAPRNDGRIRVESLNVDGRGEFDADDVMASRCPGWAIYFQSVAAIFAREGLRVPGCDALVHGTLPIASGLSSSASLESATAVLLTMLGGHAIERVRLARLCQRAENEIVGVNCGILDQYSSIFGEAGAALVLDCRHLTHTIARLPDGLRPIICNTRASRELTGSEYGERRASCEAGATELARHVSGIKALRDVDVRQLEALESKLPEVVARRCRFVVEENARVHELARAFSCDDRDAIGRLCNASFAGARDLFEITIPAMESMHEAMIAAPGCFGARQAGAGFGGCMIALVQDDLVADFAAEVDASYQRAVGKQAEIYAVRPSDGAGPLSAE